MIEDGLAQRVKQRLDELQLQPITAAQDAGLGRDFIRDILVGRKKSVKSDQLAALASALKTTPEWLTGADPEAARMRDELIREFDRLTPQEREIVLRQVKALANADQQ